jgi:hypothetical protein
MRYQVSRINYGLFKLFIRRICVYQPMRGAVRKPLCIKWFLWNHPPIFKPTEKRLSARLSNTRWHGWFSSDESSTAVTLLATVHARSNEMLSCFYNRTTEWICPVSWFRLIWFNFIRTAYLTNRNSWVTKEIHKTGQKCWFIATKYASTYREVRGQTITATHTHT